MKKAVKKMFGWLMFLLTGKGEVANEFVNNGLVDYSGQGRDKNGF